LKALILSLIKKYQITGGSKRWFGIDCNFEPTCSAYTYDAITEFGLFNGIKRGIKRINKCSKNDSFCKCIDPIKKG
jgi:putative component of membrane protein insertase Oxa1/YidC/SpoIIIJ protein YidD